MIYSFPDYYKKFVCIADDCEDTCCAGWQIVVDEKSLEKYKQVEGPYRPQLMKSIDWKEGTFRQSRNKRCAFLRKDNLCEMYRQLGEGSLCHTCRTYPRHVEEFEGTREIALSLSCPEVAKILMEHREPVHFVTFEKKGEEEYEDFDFLLYSQLLDARDVMLEILQNREQPLAVRGRLVYGIANDMQRRINQSQLFDCAGVLEKYEKPAAAAFARERWEQESQDEEGSYFFASHSFALLHKLELLKEDWYVLRKETQLRLYARQTPYGYMDTSREFADWMNHSPIPWEIQKEQILVYFIYTYFCGGVYDGDILSKTMMALMSVFWLEEMVKARWLRNDHMLEEEEIVELVYRYSRELEHSDINLKRMEQLTKKIHSWK